VKHPEMLHKSTITTKEVFIRATFNRALFLVILPFQLQLVM